MFNMNDIYVRLANGEKIEDIGNEIAAMMNEAVAKREAEVRAAAVKAETEQAKRDLMEELVEIIQELAILEGMDPDDVEVTDEDMNQLIAAFSEMFGAMRDLKKMLDGIEAPKIVAPKTRKAVIHVKPSDDQILADFIKAFN